MVAVVCYQRFCLLALNSTIGTKSNRPNPALSGRHKWDITTFCLFFCHYYCLCHCRHSHHGPLGTNLCCSHHPICLWKTSITSSAYERWARHTSFFFFTAMYPLSICVEELSFWVLCPLQTAATWCPQRWRYSEWRVKQSSSPSQFSWECLKYATSPPQQRSTSSPRTTGQTVWAIRARGESSRATNSCGSFQLRLRTLGNTSAPTGEQRVRVAMSFLLPPCRG